MKTDRKKPKNLEEIINFDYSKNWYLTPHYPLSDYLPERSDLGPLFEGLVLENKEQFSETDNEKINSFIFITDLENTIQNLSEPFVYPIKLKNGTRIKQYSNAIWLAEKIELLKPLNFWEVFLQTESVFNGSIRFEGQIFIPNNLKLPSIVKGELAFVDNLLPSSIQLPDSVEKTMLIRSCQIPPTWKFPEKIKCLMLEYCTFYENVDFTKIDVSELFISNCYRPLSIIFPKYFKGKLHIDNDKISSEFRFPKQVGTLILCETILEKGVLFPEKVDNHLTLIDVSLSEEIKLPNTCKEFSALETKFTKGLILPKEGLMKIEMIYCTLPKKLIIPNIPNLKLSFESMKIPAGLKIGKEFTGFMEFNNCEFSKGFKLPGKIIGTLKIIYPKIKGILKLPKRGDYNFEINEDYNLSDFDIPDSIKSRIILLPSEQNPEDLSDINLPF